jgi:hypothetical protein
MGSKTFKKMLTICAVGLALAVPAVASADVITGEPFTIGGSDPNATSTVVVSKGFQNYRNGVAMQWSTLCSDSLSIPDFPSISHGDQLILPLPWLQPLNVTSGIDSQTVDYIAYLFRWNGSAWAYTNVFSRSSYYVSEQNPSGVSSSQKTVFTVGTPGYYNVAVFYNWVRNDTGTSAQQLYYWAPTTEANGSDASFCSFAS